MTTPPTRCHSCGAPDVAQRLDVVLAEIPAHSITVYFCEACFGPRRLVNRRAMKRRGFRYAGAWFRSDHAVGGVSDLLDEQERNAPWNKYPSAGACMESLKRDGK